MNFKKILMLGGAVAVMTSGLMMQRADAATEAVDIDAVIVTAIALTEVQQMDFGMLTSDVDGGTFIITPTGSADSSPDGITSVGGTVQHAIVNIQATPDLPLDTSTDASVVLAGPGPNMTVDTFNIDTDAGGNSEVITIVGPATDVDVPIGATLHVADAVTQTPGAYAGSFTFTVDYQ